jgi:hypothetical protein
MTASSPNTTTSEGADSPPTAAASQSYPLNLPRPSKKIGVKRVSSHHVPVVPVSPMPFTNAPSSYSNHRLLGPFLAIAMLVAAWDMWICRTATDQRNAELWPRLLVTAIIVYLMLLRGGRKAYQSGIASPWVIAIHAALLATAALYGFGAAASAIGASANDLRLLALTALLLCACAFAALAALERVFRIFVALTMLPVLAAGLSHSPVDLPLNAVLAMATVLLVIAHAGLARTLRNAFRADVEQRALLQRLEHLNQA